MYYDFSQRMRLMKTGTASKLEKIRAAMYSGYFSFGLFVLAGFFAVTQALEAGLVVFVVLICAVLVLSDEFAPVLLPGFLLMTFMTKSPGDFEKMVGLTYLAALFVPALLIHMILYRKKPSAGKALYGLLAVSVAVTFGGLGAISAREYFSAASLYRVIFLGFGMAAIYVFLSGAIRNDGRKKLEDFFSRLFFAVALFGCFMVLAHYAVNYRELIETGRALPFRWRNAVATMMMATMPFAFYLSLKKYAYLWTGILIYAGMLLTGSRGGIIFGSVQFLLCMVYVIVYDQKNRKRNIITFSVIVLLILVFTGRIYTFLFKTPERLVDESTSRRWKLVHAAVRNFKESPLFGKGLAYTGNASDIYKPKKFFLLLIESSPFQIISSFGILGIIAYSFSLFNMGQVLLAKRSSFGIAVALGVLGLEMMSLVNTGIFSPFPFAFMLTLFLVLAEKYDPAGTTLPSADTQAVQQRQGGAR